MTTSRKLARRYSYSRKLLRVLPEPLGENVHPVPLIKLDGDTKERDVVLIRLLLPDPNS